VTSEEEPSATAEAELRERVRVLADAAGLPVPPLEIAPDPRGRLLPAHVRNDRGRERVVVSSDLPAAPAGEQTWHLAAALGWWASPEPRRRRRQVKGLLVALFLAGVIAVVVGPLVGVSFGVIVLGVVALGWPAANALNRWERRALDDAGHGVLAAAGHDPAALTRQVFGNRPEPGWFERVLGTQPTPRQRVAAAEAWRPGSR
jgi:hypothetical protein